MTGTAATEAEEFGQIYNLEVVEIPTNKPVSRLDEHDEVYRSYEEKLEAIVREIAEANAKMQPMLVGTTSIEKSEQLAEYLVTKGWTMLDVSQPGRAADALQGGARGQAVEAVHRAQRPLPRAGGLYRRRGRRAGRRHGRHQHGRPRHRHPARRQRRDARREGARRHGGRPRARAARGGDPRRGGRLPRRPRRRAASTSSAPSATRADASTTSCAAARAARATRAAPSSTCP